MATPWNIAASFDQNLWPPSIFVHDFIYREYRDEYYCILCDYDFLNYRNCIEHVNGKYHMYYVENYGTAITPENIEDDTYYCSTCDCVIPGYRNINTHIMGKRHQSLAFDATAYFQEDERLSFVDWKDCKYFECPYVSVEDCGIYYCIICDRESHGHFSLENHVRGNSHRTAIQLYGRHISPLRHNKFYCTPCDRKISCYRRVYDHLMGQEHELMVEREENTKKCEDSMRETERWKKEAESLRLAMEETKKRKKEEEKEDEKRRAEKSVAEKWKMEAERLEFEREEMKKWKEEAKSLQLEMERMRIWKEKEKADAEKWEMEKIEANKWRREVESLKLSMEKAEKWREEKEMTERREIERRDAEISKLAMEMGEKWRKEAETLKLEMKKAEKWKNEELKNAERWETEKSEGEISKMDDGEKFRKKEKAEEREAEKWKEEAVSLKLEMEKREEEEKAERCETEKTVAEIANLGIEEGEKSKKEERMKEREEEKLKEEAASLMLEVEKLKKNEIEEAERCETEKRTPEISKLQMEDGDKFRKEEKLEEREAEKWKKEAVSLKREMEKTERWKKEEKEKAERCETEKTVAEISNLKIEEGEKSRKEDKAEGKEAEKLKKEAVSLMLEVEKWKKEENKAAERCETETRASEILKLEMEKAEKCRKEEKEIAEEWETEAANLKPEMEKAEKLEDKAERLRAEKRDGDKIWKVEENGKAIKLKAEKVKIEEILKNSKKGKQQEAELQKISDNSDKAELSEFVKSQNSSINEKPEKFTRTRNIKVFKKDTSCNAGKDYRQRSKASWMTREEMEKFVNLLDFNEDIYDMREKVREIKLGMELSLVKDTKNIYCLVCRTSIENDAKIYFQHLYDIEHCEYLEGMEKDHALFELVPGQFSDLYLAHQYLEDNSEDAITCLVCKEDLCDENENLQRHIDDANHREAWENMHTRINENFHIVPSRMHCDWYRVLNYRCVTCEEDFITEIDFVEHLSSSEKHENFLKKLDINEIGLIYDYCSVCSQLWYGYRSTYAHHCESSTHKWHLRNGNSLSEKLPESSKRLLTGLEKYVNDTIGYLGDVKKKERKRDATLIGDLEELARKKIPKARAHAFGPRETGFGSPDSNVYIFLDCGDMYDGKNSSYDHISNLMSTVHKSLSEDSESWSTEKISTIYRNFSFKARHRKTGLACEISFENGLAVETTKLVKLFNEKFPACRKLIIFLNQWLTFCNLSGSEPNSSYALEWCVIFYLQNESILPSVAALMAKKNVSQVICGWEVGTTDDFTCDSTFTSIRELVVGFFAFYSSFDYRYDVACPRLGETVKKRAFAKMQKLPNEMQAYIERINNHEDFQPLRIDATMCIQNPLKLNENLTSFIGKPDLSRFRAYCSKSLEFLNSS